MVFSSAPPALRNVLCMPNLALESAIACRVFSQLRIGFMADFGGPLDSACTCVARQGLLKARESSFGGGNSESMDHGGVHVEVTRTTDSRGDPGLSSGASSPKVFIKDSEKRGTPTFALYFYHETV
jgi:hypothetical protein